MAKRAYNTKNRFGKKAGGYKDGRTLKKYYCIGCNKEINWQTAIKGSYKCKVCSGKDYKIVGKNHINWKEEIHKKYYCKKPNCNNPIHYNTWKKGSGRCKKCFSVGLNRGITRSKKTRSLMSLAMGGSGVPYENNRYPEKFNIKLKTKIKIRDNYTCQNLECKIKLNKHSRNLQVYHIDYNKQNCKESNLISLCSKCNMKANFNKEHWEDYYTNIIKTLH